MEDILCGPLFHHLSPHSKSTYRLLALPFHLALGPGANISHGVYGILVTFVACGPCVPLAFGLSGLGPWSVS